MRASRLGRLALCWSSAQSFTNAPGQHEVRVARPAPPLRPCSRNRLRTRLALARAWLRSFTAVTIEDRLAKRIVGSSWTTRTCEPKGDGGVRRAIARTGDYRGQTPTGSDLAPSTLTCPRGHGSRSDWPRPRTAPAVSPRSSHVIGCSLRSPRAWWSYMNVRPCSPAKLVRYVITDQLRVRDPSLNTSRQSGRRPPPAPECPSDAGRAFGPRASGQHLSDVHQGPLSDRLHDTDHQ